jgi:hypothetical protein
MDREKSTTLNLVQHRSGPTVWDRVESTPEWDIERWLLGVTAAAFVFAGFRQRSLGGLLLALGGSGLAWWAATGTEVRRYRRRRFKDALPGKGVAGDLIGEASEESFPASDAPAWTPTTGNTAGPSSHTTH